MIETCTCNAGMPNLVEQVLSIELVRQYKATCSASQLAPAAIEMLAGNVLFVSSNGRITAGADWFGVTKRWISRTGQPEEAFGVSPTAIDTQFTAVIDFIRQYRGRGS